VLRDSSFGFQVSGRELRVSSFGYQAWGFGSRILGARFRVSDFGLGASGFGFRVSSFGYQASGFRIRVSGAGFRESNFGYHASGFKLRVSGVGCRGSGIDPASGIKLRVPTRHSRRRRNPRPETPDRRFFPFEARNTKGKERRASAFKIEPRKSKHEGRKR